MKQTPVVVLWPGSLGRSAPNGSSFLELHRARNSVQHEGILPLAEQLPLWLAETEQLIDAIVAACFGVGLDSVRSADGVADPELRGLLQDSEDLLGRGDAAGSFGKSWGALELARRRFRERTGLHQISPTLGIGPGSLIRLDGELKTVTAEVQKLSGEVEVSAFTAEPGEWLWLRQRKAELFGRGPTPDRAEAGRAFVFTLGWILRYESYIARHGVDRWERLRAEEKAPVTGLPGGPHLKAVDGGEVMSLRRPGDEPRRNWIFQLTDVPESKPSFEWALHQASREMEGSPLTEAWLDGWGRLSVTFPVSLKPARVRTAVEDLLETAKETLRLRAAEDANAKLLDTEIETRFRAGLASANCPVEEVEVLLPDGGGSSAGAQAKVRIVVPGPDEGQSSFSKRLGETFDQNFPEAADVPGEYRGGFRDAVVPSSWDPEQVGRWIKEAVAFDEETRAAGRKAREEKAKEEARALEEMRRLLGEGSG